MRTINVYTFDELSEKAEEKAFKTMKNCYEDLNACNVSYEEILDWIEVSDTSFDIDGNVVFTTIDTSIIVGTMQKGMMTMVGKYVYGFDDYCFTGEEYDTPEEALAAAQEEEKESLPDETHTVVYIGTVGEKWKPEIDGERIVDMLHDDAYDFGGEIAENYLQEVPTEEIDELTKVLTKAFNEWAAKHGYKPGFYPVENVKEYEL